MFLTSSHLDGVAHGFFGRKGGVSTGLYASLNCGLGSGDIMDHVIENRERVAAKLGGKGTKLLGLHQVHSNEVVTVEMPWRNAKKPKADAMVTRKPGLALGILTADCVPVLLCDKTHGVIGAAHAGWKGALAGVLERTVEAMLALGAKCENIRAAIGPCIQQHSYEVSADFRDTFLKGDASNERYFIPGTRGEHFMFDISGYAHMRLQHAGLTQVNPLENDTYMEEDAFFSYRRATHKGEPDYGRQISAIMLTL